MKMSVEHALEFKDYLMPLRLLEKSFREAGLTNIEFRAFISEGGDKRIEISFGGRTSKVISIEGDSPAQAVKDVAAAVRL
jgi:hypothetical protein